MFGSDISHWDVPDMTEVLEEAYEMVEHELDHRRRLPRLHVHQPGALLHARQPVVLRRHRGRGGRRPVPRSAAAAEAGRHARSPAPRVADVVDGTGRAGAGRPTSASATAASSRSAPSTSPRRASIDADGLVVAPGFVDIHTHYDAQAAVGPDGQPVAAARRHHGDRRQLRLLDRAARARRDVDYIMRMMARVEGMPLDALEAGPAWDWRTLRRVARPARRPPGRQRRLPRRPLDDAAAS